MNGCKLSVCGPFSQNIDHCVLSNNDKYVHFRNLFFLWIETKVLESNVERDERRNLQINATRHYWDARRFIHHKNLIKCVSQKKDVCLVLNLYYRQYLLEEVIRDSNWSQLSSSLLCVVLSFSLITIQSKVIWVWMNFQREKNQQRSLRREWTSIFLKFENLVWFCVSWLKRTVVKRTLWECDVVWYGVVWWSILVSSDLFTTIVSKSSLMWCDVMWCVVCLVCLHTLSSSKRMGKWEGTGGSNHGGRWYS
jgi:hypothetical protein